MIRFSVVFSGLENDIMGQSAPIIRSFTRGVEQEAKRLMVLRKNGREYRRRGGRVHRASAPGETPAIDYGGLFRSFRLNFPSPNIGEIRIEADYAEYLEFGTRRMRERPFVRPAIDGTIRQFREAGIIRGVRRSFE